MVESWAGAVETHTAALFFAGERVYKVKKPVRLDFLDLSSRDSRRRACEAEVALNRRLAPDVYLGVASIGIDGRPAEHAVVMRRLPAATSLAARVRADDRDLDHRVRQVADVLAAFHATCLTVGRELPSELWSPPIELWRTEIDRVERLQDAALDPDRLQLALALAERYARGRDGLFAQRLAAGLVRDGHGDLLASDIYLLPDGPRVLDCLEFDTRLRVCDVLHDVAFLAMDLEHRGRADLAGVLLDRYSRTAAETHPATLAHFYVAHRALIRAKVHAIRADQRGVPDGTGDGFLDLCLRHLEQAQVRLVMVGGLPGAGKSTLAAELARRLPARMLSSDQIRYELARGLPPSTGFDTGRYAPAVSERVYRALLRLARQAAEQGESVVLDASWRSSADRRSARDLAAAVGAVPVELLAEVDDATAGKRLADRSPVPGGSEATEDIRREMSSHFDQWPGARSVSTDTSLDDCVAAALAATRAATGSADVQEGATP